jgi:hypothetical protein
LLGKRSRTDYPQEKLGGTQTVSLARVVAQAEEQGARVGAVIPDKVRSLPIRRGENALPQRNHQVLLVKTIRLDAPQMSIQPPCEGRQARIAHRVLEIGRHQGEPHATAVAFIPAGKQVVIYS